MLQNSIAPTRRLVRTCFKCHKRDLRTVDSAIIEDDRVVWHCMACGTARQMSN